MQIEPIHYEDDLIIRQINRTNEPFVLGRREGMYVGNGWTDIERYVCVRMKCRDKTRIGIFQGHKRLLI